MVRTRVVTLSVWNYEGCMRRSEASWLGRQDGDGVPPTGTGIANFGMAIGGTLVMIHTLLLVIRR